jgi:D-inositol-3-phosphate glycosyltransferase
MRSKLRIGMVTHYMPPHIGGIEICADQLFRSYKEAGHEVHWVASRMPPQAPSQENGRVRIGCWNWLEHGLGVPWPVWGPASLPTLGQLINWADVLHIHDCLYLGSLITATLAKKAGKPLVLSQHIGKVYYPAAVLNAVQSLAYRTIGRAVIRLASHVVFCTPPAEQFIRKVLRVQTNGASRISNGIDTERFRPPTPEERALARRSLGIQNAHKVVLFVGRLLEKKGIDLFLAVSRERPDLHFLVVGDGPRRPAAAANLSWLPYVPHDRMAFIYQAGDFLMLPSQGEGFPVAVQEAMAMGIPVIVSQEEAFVALLESEKTCLATARTVESLCEALERLGASPGLANDLGHRSRELVVREWSLQAMTSRYLDLLQELSGMV